MNALHQAVAKGDLRKVRELVEYYKYNPNSTGFTGLNPTPLATAAEYGQRHIMEYLIKQGADLQARGYWGWGSSPIETALSYHHLQATVCLIANNASLPAQVHRTDLGNTLLFEAAKTNDTWSIENILKHTEADINIHEAFMQRTPLHTAAMFDSFDAINTLVARGAKVTTIDEHGWTPLHYATSQGDLQIVALLIKHGARVNAEDNDGRTPLFSAVGSGDTEIIELLYAKGGKINTEDNHHTTPLSLAIINDDTDTIRCLAQLGAKLGEDSYKQTPLHMAALLGKSSAVEVFIDLGLNMNAKDINQNTPIELAYKMGNLEVVNTLLMHGAFLPTHMAATLTSIDSHTVLLTPEKEILSGDTSTTTTTTNTENTVIYGPSIYHQPHIADGGIDLQVPIY